MMVSWQYCVCGKIVDEYEERCHWCGRPVGDSEESEPKEDKRQLRLFDVD